MRNHLNTIIRRTR